MKLRTPLFVLALLSLGLANVSAFNLIDDVTAQTKWDLGNVASAGTSVNLENGQYTASEFAEIWDYRFLSGWYGGIEVPQGDGTMKLTDSAKLGLSLGYFLKDFVNKPPAVIQNLIVGPAIGVNLASSPHTVQYFVDINYQFGH